MRTGQRDLNNKPLKRRLSISYEELETLKKSIKVSVLNELRTEMECSSDLDSLKDLILSDIRTELMGMPSPASLKASVLNELRMELNHAPVHERGAAENKLKELAGIQDGLVKELLDQKSVVRRLEADVEKLSRKLEELQNSTPDVAPSVSLSMLEDPLDLPPLSKKPKQKPEPRKEIPSPRARIEVREVPAPLPGTNARVRLKVREVEPEELDEEEVEEIKCEYIIADSGELKRQKVARTVQRSRENNDCEYIIAEKSVTHIERNETVVARDDEDAEIITCER
ncbi:hypothetical protein MSMTP_0302 [Methanosarcina sp. MTP4]|uniref:hypothetical protein n=1 Tax=Methanosarcina sp. MTP4 TaxID=1434100 RepID=UPI000615A7DD|nr:hypothetical protein [Methanosarcina sp. MTP4]AKB23771.1 hypothetical protein MSMTP_0302 [Methanosarcina sp. MTP4]